jgi:hypothetical protein
MYRIGGALAQRKPDRKNRRPGPLPRAQKIEFKLEQNLQSRGSRRTQKSGGIHYFPE